MDRSEFRVAGHYTSFVSRVHLVPEEPVVVDETLILAVHPSPRQEVEIKVAYQLRGAGVPVTYMKSQVVQPSDF